MIPIPVSPKTGLPVLLCLAALAAPVVAAPVAEWRHDSFEEFIAGTPGNAGHNIYVSRDGRVRTIRRHDLNQDGFIDLLYNSTHDWHHYLPATLASFDRNRVPKATEINVLGSGRAFVRDLNQDGHADLFFQPNRQNLQHSRSFLNVFWGGPEGWSAQYSTRLLPVNDPTSSAIVDLNEDKWPDLVALNTEAWLVGQPAGYIVRIYWGGPEGYQVFRYKDIGVKSALELAGGDLDGNGFDDLAVATTNGTVEIFWSGKQGADGAVPAPTSVRVADAAGADSTTQSRAGTVTSKGAVQAITIADANRDGRGDLVVGTRINQILVLSFDGRNPQATRKIDAFNASHVTVADADADGWPDFVLTDLALAKSKGGEAAGAEEGSGTVAILWGGPNGPVRDQATRLSVPQSIGTAVGDYDGDGKPDVAVAVHEGDATTTAQSRIYFGAGNRKFETKHATVQTQGAMHPVTVPGKPDRVLFCNSLAGTIGENVPLFIYWGDRAGFSEKNLWQMPSRAGYKSLAADLQADGHVDLVPVNSGHGLQAGEKDPEMGAHVYWGGKTGISPGPNKFDLKRRIVLNEPNLGGSNVGDLNRDGYLDLVLGAFETRGEKNANLVIYYGSAEGYSTAKRVALPNEDRTLGCVLADFNRDGWLEIAVVASTAHRVTIFEGGPDGYAENRKQELALAGAIDAESADLNNDGWLDLVVGSYWDPVAKHMDAGLTIYWGGAQGFQPWRSQWLPGWTPIGIAIADLDGDKHLDIISPHYHAEMTREDVPSYIYWGGPEGYSVLRRRSLPVNSSHDVTVADFDRDGRLDLAFSAHSNNNGHLIKSPIYFNDGNRFEAPRVQYLTTRGTHFMSVQDIGNLANRELVETYDSPVLKWDGDVTSGQIAADAEVPKGARVELLVRSAASDSPLDQQAWKPVVNGRIQLAKGDRALQYRVRFHSPDGDAYPVLTAVNLSVTR